MADLPDYYTQAQISEAEAASVKGGLEANLPVAPVSRDIYFATDKDILYICVVDGAWTGFDASILTQGILTLYANMLGGGFRITNIADPTAAQDAATRAYVLAQAALRLALTGGTMAGNIVMGGNKVTGLGAPAAQDDALRYNRLEIRNAEIAAGAAITYAKLNLALGIVNGDIAAAAAIVYSKLNLTGAIKKGDIEAAAGIEYSKLALAASIVMADFAAAIQNAANGIVVLDASADVPDAQIPNLAAGKITSDRFPVDRLPAMTDEKIWKGTGANVEEVDMPSGWATLTVAETEVFSGNSPTSWTDLNLSGTVGAQSTLVILKITSDSVLNCAVRKNGDTDEFFGTVTDAKGAACAKQAIGMHVVLIVCTDSNGIIEWYSTSAEGTTIDVIGYVK